MTRRIRAAAKPPRPFRVGDRVRLTEDYWFENKGRLGTVTRLDFGPLDTEALQVWVQVDGDERALPMPDSILEREPTP